MVLGRRATVLAETELARLGSEPLSPIELLEGLELNTTSLDPYGNRPAP